MKDPAEFLQTLLSHEQSSIIVWGIVALVSLVYLVVSGILFYHWFKYGEGNRGVFIAQILYIIISIVLLVFMFAAALLLTSHA